MAELMNAAVSALGIRMFEARRVLAEQWRPLLGGAGLTSLGSLFGTAWAAGAAGLPPALGLALAQRSVMSALGMAGAEILGASPNLAVASILLTGVYGASLGPSLLQVLGLGPRPRKPKAGGTEEGMGEGGAGSEPAGGDHTVSRGVAMGTSAHAIGTAALMAEEPDAAAISSVALCVAGIVHTAVLSVPAAQRAVHALVKSRAK